MNNVNFLEEKRLYKKGFKVVVGIDEAGRGPLAGPVVASAVFVPFNYKNEALGEVNDSKKLTEKKREKIFEILTDDENIKWGVGIVSEKEIDKINILQATKLAMTKAIACLVGRQACLPARQVRLNPDYLLIDGNFKLDSEIEQKSITRGDQKVFSIALASIIAKVTRDRLMQKYHKKYPAYGFDKHKGYGTKAHFASIEKHGPCKIHRKSFNPVSKFFN